MERYKELTQAEMWALLQNGGTGRLTADGRACEEPVRYTAAHRQGQMVFTLTDVDCGALCAGAELRLELSFDTLEGTATICVCGRLALPRCPARAEKCLIADCVRGRVCLRPSDCCECRLAAAEPCPEPSCERRCPPKPEPRRPARKPCGEWFE